MKVYKPQKIYKTSKIKFKGLENENIYNTTIPIEFEGEKYILGRSEDPKTNKSFIRFYKKENSTYILDKSFPSYNLEDPFITKIKGLYVVGGVDAKINLFGKWTWKTIFYIGKDLKKLKKIGEGPKGMKDIRLIELPSGTIGVFTRPQGKVGGRGKIGYFEIKSLRELNSKKISKAKLITNYFAKGEWGGANFLTILKSGKIGVLGHIAKYDRKGNRHYFPITFAFNPITKKSSTMRIIAKRSDFEKSKTKRKDLYDVIFPGGLIRQKNNKVTMYAGIADAETHKMTMSDPFKYYEDNDEKIFSKSKK